MSNKTQYIAPVLGAASSFVVLINIDDITTILALIMAIANTFVVIYRLIKQIIDAIKKWRRGEKTIEEITAEIQNNIMEVKQNADTAKSDQSDGGEFSDKNYN